MIAILSLAGALILISLNPTGDVIGNSSIKLVIG